MTQEQAVQPNLTANASRSAIICAESLYLHFDDGRIKAIDGIDLQIEEGEFVALVGPSGCGKSSLLNLIGMLDLPTAGQITFRSSPYAEIRNSSRFRRSHIGFIFQSFHLIPTLSALENVLVATVGIPGSRNTHAKRAGDLLDSLGLSDRINQFPNELSGGERQRVAIARSLVNNPDVILADEPTGSLDSANALEVLELIGRVRRERKITVIVATHDANVSSRTDRVISMRDGKIEKKMESRQ